MDSKQQQIEVAVVARNASGSTEILICSVHATKAEQDDGAHYDAASRRAQDEGFQPIAAFDATEPAWKVIADGRKYKRFFDDATESLQEALLGERHASGADTIDAVNQLFSRHNEGEEVYIAFSADGYWSNRDGWVGEAGWATVFRDPAPLRQLKNSGALTVAAVQLNSADDLLEFPSVPALSDAAEGALARAQKYEFTIDEANASEVLREELELAQCSAPAAAMPVLAAYLLHAKEKRREQNASRVAERG